MIVIHHMPGYDEGTKEIARNFAANGYAALIPNLYYRVAPTSSPDDAAATARSLGGVSDEQLVGDAEGAMNYLKALDISNGRVGVIGYCSGGRQSFLGGLRLPVNAVIDCYGAFVTGTVPDGFPLKVVPLVDRTGALRCPLLGLFGADDQFPTPAHVAELEEALIAHEKTFEFHSYEGAGHAFFSTDRPSYRPEAALDGWQRIFAWFGQYLSTSEA